MSTKWHVSDRVASARDAPGPVLGPPRGRGRVHPRPLRRAQRRHQGSLTVPGHRGREGCPHGQGEDDVLGILMFVS